MGTTTFYLKNNDFGIPLNRMNKEDLDKLSKISPYKENHFYSGWNVPLELHNGNIYVLIFWKGKLIRLEDAPKILNKKYYNKYSGKTIREYEWTLLKKLIINEVNRIDKEFKKSLRKSKK